MAARLIAFPRSVPVGLIAAALKRHRLPDALAEALVRDAQGWPGYAPDEALACALARRMRPEPIDLAGIRGILLLGPAGAGKSTVAARIAAAARALGRTVSTPPVVEGLVQFRDGPPPGGGLSVMEAQGFNPANRRALAAFAALGGFHGVESVVVLPAAIDAEEAADILATLHCKRVIVTGLDRTRRLGALTAAATGPARLAHVLRTDGDLDTLEPDALARLLLA